MCSRKNTSKWASTINKYKQRQSNVCYLSAQLCKYFRDWPTFELKIEKIPGNTDCNFAMPFIPFLTYALSIYNGILNNAFQNCKILAACTAIALQSTHINVHLYTAFAGQKALEENLLLWKNA